MVMAVDTNVFLDIFLDDPQFRQKSFYALANAFEKGEVVVSEVVWAETGAAFGDRNLFLEAMSRLNIRFVPMPETAATVAADMWRVAKMRKTLPPRRVLADFLVGAHAKACADCLLTRDKGFYREYFNRLTVVEP